MNKEEVGNPKREPSSELNPLEELFKHHKPPLGSQHIIVQEVAGGVECGMNCPHRLNSITCPFFEGVPCLVGCEIKQTLPGEGLLYEELDIFVTSQAGKFLIGGEIIINLENPRASRIRIITNKLGKQILPAGAIEGLSLFDLKQRGFSLGGVLEKLEKVGIDIHAPLEFPVGNDQVEGDPSFAEAQENVTEALSGTRASTEEEE